MEKKSQQDPYSFLNYRPEVNNKSLEDLYVAIRADAGLTPSQKLRLIDQVQGLVGYTPSNTPLSALMYKGLGGAIGYWISKYFGMGAIGQTISAMAGYGLGSVINDQLNKPKDPFPGFKLL